MKTKTINLYSFDELSERAKQKAIENLWDLNVDHGWWECTYEDAERIGLKIKGFDIDRGSYVDGEFMASAEETAHLIEKEHGEQCDTYKTAVQYLEERDKIIDESPKDENDGFEDEYKLDNDLDQLDSKFLKSLCEDYRIILQKEYEYLTSEEAIIESIQANEYTFTEDGKLCN